MTVDDDDRRRVPPASLVVAGILVVIGVVVTVWRPLAPSLAPVPTDLDRLPPSIEAAIQAYRAPRLVAAIGLYLLGIVVPVGIVVSRGGRRFLARLVGTRHDRWRGPARGALVAATLMGAVVAAGLPIRAWAGIVHDGDWQVRTAPAWAWWGRVLGQELLAIAVVALLAAGLVLLVRRRPRTWGADLVVAGTAVVAVATLLWPMVVGPLIAPTRALGDGPTAQAVRATLAAAGMDDLAVVVSERSRIDVRANAMVVGLGPSRQVMLDDTLLTQPVDEVVAVVAHELAHQRNRDLERGVVGAAVLLAVAAGVVMWAWRRDGVRAWVADGGTPVPRDDPRLVAVAVAIVVAMGIVLEPMGLWQSRRVEAAADAGAHELGATADTIVRVKRRLAITNLSRLDPPGWQVVLFSTHPSAGDRIRTAVARAALTGEELPDRAALEGEEATDPPAWSPPPGVADRAPAS